MAREVTWIMPLDTHDAGNVWVLIAESKHERGIIKVLRVFSTEPTESMIDYQRRAFSGDPADTDIEVHEVALDYFDLDEIENAGC